MSEKLLKKMHHMIRAITEEEFFIVGGAVRDTLYGVEPKDYDCILCVGPDLSDNLSFRLIQELESHFLTMGFGTNVYQSYGQREHPDDSYETDNPTSFQAMFHGCMKVAMGNCQVDILLSKATYPSEHVQRHDCNMNMVWFNGNRICWEHGGAAAKVDHLTFQHGVCEERIKRMTLKFNDLTTVPPKL